MNFLLKRRRFGKDFIFLGLRFLVDLIVQALFYTQQRFGMLLRDGDAFFGACVFFILSCCAIWSCSCALRAASWVKAGLLTRANSSVSLPKPCKLHPSINFFQFFLGRRRISSRNP